jgi:hypothetical protein
LPCVWPFYLPGICAAAVSIVLRGSALALRYLALGRSSQRRPVALPPNRTMSSLQYGLTLADEAHAVQPSRRFSGSDGRPVFRQHGGIWLLGRFGVGLKVCVWFETRSTYE